MPNPSTAQAVDGWPCERHGGGPTPCRKNVKPCCLGEPARFAKFLLRRGKFLPVENGLVEPSFQGILHECG
jgi:hypothetical protein